MSDDLISRLTAIEEIRRYITKPNISDDESEIKGFNDGLELAISVLSVLTSVQPEIVRCKDCKWWDKKDEESTYGYCHACKHGYWSEHWEISIYRTYKGDWFCADGERREE